MKRMAIIGTGIAGLGCVCLTFDLAGHGAGEALQGSITREDNLRDLLAAYDRLVAHPRIDPNAVAVVGTSYGGYLAAILTELRDVRWLALRVPAMYRDEDWSVPKRDLPRDDLMAYRASHIPAASNRALKACAGPEQSGVVKDWPMAHVVCPPHVTWTMVPSCSVKHVALAKG